MVSTDNKKCYGCSACAAVCPQKCIQMQANEEGFFYPNVSVSDCVHCGKCDAVCPIGQDVKSCDKLTAYAGKNKLTHERISSSSGGIFLPIAKSVVEHGGVVFGVALNDSFLAVHAFAETVQDLQKFCGSKYMQSDIGNSFADVKRFLEQEREVLFTGTPCQVAGLKHYLGKEYDTLYTLDLVCHGVPSPALWLKYLKSFKRGMPQSVSFRDKSSGWGSFSVRITFPDYTHCVKYFKDTFYEMFLANFTLRESCYTCEFKGGNLYGDLTIADFWGVGDIVPEMNDDKGVSLILQNSEKGNQLLERVRTQIDLQLVDRQRALQGNKAAAACPARSPRRDKYLNAMRKNKSYSYIYDNCYQSTKLERLKTNVIKILRRT